MLTVGLTGGIGCGKTTVTNLFIALGVPVIDADDIAHQLIRPGQPALQCIVEQFGSDFLLANGELNRNKLRSHIYNNAHDKKKLEEIMHPLVFDKMKLELDKLNVAYGILSIPLLFETDFQHSVDQVVVIDCDESTQIKRVRQRDNLSIKEVKSIMSSQCTRTFRIKNADEIIDNNGSLEALEQQVQTFHEKFLNISAGIKRLNPSK
jgi:dephospho-CoA kinase